MPEPVAVISFLQLGRNALGCRSHTVVLFKSHDFFDSPTKRAEEASG